MKETITILVMCASLHPAFSQSSDNELPKVFLPVSTGYNERDMAISPDGKEMYYTVQAPRNGLSVILRRTLKDNQWSDVEVAPFSGQFSDLEAAFSPDGRKLFFVSNRPIKQGGVQKDYDIWYLEKNSQGWSEPIHAGMQLNSSGEEYYPSVTNDGSVYFTGVRPDALGKEDIYKCQWANNQFQPAVNIGSSVNSKLDEFNAFVDPGEQYIILGVEGGEGDLGRGDLYISYKNQDGSWSIAKNLGPVVNSNRLDYCPFVHNGTFYFTSERPTPWPKDKRLPWSDTKAKLDNWGNGFGDIYYVPLNKIIQTK